MTGSLPNSGGPGCNAASARFLHDCDRCIYIGTVKTHALYDVYVCGQLGHPTLVARFGNDGPDYISGGHDIARQLCRETA